MSVKVGSARSSFGNTSAGDQNGKELSTQAWYEHSDEWYMLRPISAEAAEKIAYACEAACKNDLIGYDQGTRNTLYSKAKQYGFDPKKVREKCNTDCSALVRVCCAYAGINVKNFTTSDEKNVLVDSGAFRLYTEDKYCKSSAYLCRGDILVSRKKGHTVVVLSNGSKAEKRTGETGSKTLKVKNGSWNIRKGPGLNYEAVGTVHSGEAYAYTEISESGWVHIKAGWISPKAVEL